MPKMRLRFAPSPTGYLHIGGVRTALYSWLYARKNGGEFVLRIEDTDRERSTEESVQIVLESMRWLGLDWDEGPGKEGPNAPYFQSQRLALYREHAERLVASGNAYRCYATKEEIAEARAAHAASGGKGFRFESPYRDGKAPSDPNAPYVYRFKSPKDGVTGWDDLVKGRIDVPNEVQQDFILLRTDGMPLYNFGCVVDDLTMGISHVCRGDDHVVNTPAQLLLYAALGATAPAFAHLPMVLAPNGEKLSKRHAAVGVTEYREMGYLPESVLNYLARLGWSHGDQEIFSRDELIRFFDWDHVGSTAGKYDAKKFASVQAEHFRAAIDATPERIAEGLLPFLAALGVTITADDPRLVPAMRAMKVRATNYVELAQWTEYFFRDPVLDEALRKDILAPDAAETLTALVMELQALPVFDEATLEATTKAWVERTERKLKKVAQAARVSVTGRAHGGLFDVMAVIGRERTLARLLAGAKFAQG